MKDKVSLKRLLGILERFRRARVLVVGDIILDQFIWGKVRRISPEAPVPVVEVEKMTFSLGGAANVAAGVAALGGEAALIGLIGADMYGGEVMKLLEERGISAGGVIRENARPTTIKTRIIAHGQQVVRYDREMKEKPTAAQLRKITAWLDNDLKEINAVVLSDYDKGVLRGTLGPNIIGRARRIGVAVTADPKVPNMKRFRGADVITPNQLEAEQATGLSIDSDASLERAGRSFLRKYRPRALLITRGEAGMSLFLRGEWTVHVPAVARQVFDVTGAGDTAIAVFTLALAVKSNPLEATWLANAAAAVTVGKLGTATVSAQELEKSLKKEIGE